MPFIIGVNIQIIPGNDHKATCREFLLSDININCGLLSLGILGATRQEMTNNKLVYTLFIALFKQTNNHNKKNSRVKQCYSICDNTANCKLWLPLKLDNIKHIDSLHTTVLFITFSSNIV